jgi:hypothetical protein
MQRLLYFTSAQFQKREGDEWRMKMQEDPHSQTVSLAYYSPRNLHFPSSWCQNSLRLDFVGAKKDGTPKPCIGFVSF